MEWNSLSFDRRKEVLSEIVNSMTRQIGNVLDRGKNNSMGTSIVISSGDLTDPVGMFRIGDISMGVELGLISKSSNVEPNIVIATRTIKEYSDSGIQEKVVIMGVSAEGETLGYYYDIMRTGDKDVKRVGEAKEIAAGEDMGRVKEEMIQPFLKGRAMNGDSPVSLDKPAGSRNRPKNVETGPGAFWVEIWK